MGTEQIPGSLGERVLKVVEARTEEMLKRHPEYSPAEAEAIVYDQAPGLYEAYASRFSHLPAAEGVRKFAEASAGRAAAEVANVSKLLKG